MQREITFRPSRGRPGSSAFAATQALVLTAATLLAMRGQASAALGDSLLVAMARREAAIQSVEFRDAASSRVEVYPLSLLRRLTADPARLKAAIAAQRAYQSLPKHEWVNLVRADNPSGTMLEVAERGSHSAPGERPNPMGFTERFRSPQLLEILFWNPPGPDAALSARPQELLRVWPPREGFLEALCRVRVGRFLLTDGGRPRWEVLPDGRHQFSIVAFDHPAGLAGSRWRFWLDRRCGDRPVRWDIFDAHGRLGWQHTVSYRRYGADTWFFSRYQWRAYYLGPRGSRALRYTETHQVSSALFNRGTSPGGLTIPVSVGTGVMDQRYGLSYREGAREYSDRELLRLKRDPELLAASPIGHLSAAAGPIMPWSWLLTLVGTLLLLAGAYSHHRLFRSRPEPAEPAASDAA